MKTKAVDGGSPASFRDPSGFLFWREGELYRQVNPGYKQDYDHLIDSGLYDSLVAESLLVPHREVDDLPGQSAATYKVIKPERLDFISYPYEWCFSQLKDAALLTLKIQRTAMESGMSLKDASAYNVQFRGGKPVFIDTLSFERYVEGRPWVAYRQFCRHFLAPLALMAYRDPGLGRLSRVYLDGIPLALTDRLLPWRTRLRFTLMAHLHLHAGGERRFSAKPVDPAKIKISKVALGRLTESLESAIKGLKWEPGGTEWNDYYDNTNYSEDAFKEKEQLVARFIDQIGPGDLWDLGANEGVFSRIAGDKGVRTLSCDLDPAAVEKNYLFCRKTGSENILPLCLDLTNPSPGIGWSHEERMSFIERGPADAVLALALVHHLAISNNLPLEKIADFFSRVGESLIIEFVPKEDSQVQRLLATREDIFPDYTRAGFEAAFSRYFQIVEAAEVAGSARTLYLMRTLPRLAHA